MMAPDGRRAVLSPLKAAKMSIADFDEMKSASPPTFCTCLMFSEFSRRNGSVYIPPRGAGIELLKTLVPVGFGDNKTYDSYLDEVSLAASRRAKRNGGGR